MSPLLAEAPTIEYLVKPSKRLRRIVIAVHMAAAGACVLSAAPPSAKSVLMLLLGAHLYLSWVRLKRGRFALRYFAASGWHIGGDAVTVLPSTVITPYAIWLHYKSQNARKQALLIMSDALPAAEYRHLIVKLKTAEP